jgi:hypothetical protein
MYLVDFILFLKILLSLILIYLNEFYFSHTPFIMIGKVTWQEVALDYKH